MIVFDNVTKYYKSNVGLEKVSVRINKGDFVFLVGPSGAGKSTFIKLILKEIDATSGSIKVRGREVTTMSNRQVPILRRNIGIVFQDFRLLPKKTVYENVALAMEIIHQPKKLIKKYVPQVLSMVGIASKANKYPDELSAGEQQRTGEELAAEIAQDCVNVLQKLQAASCDAVGFGKIRIRAFPDVPAWESLNWPAQYETLPVRVTADVKILQ